MAKAKARVRARKSAIKAPAAIDKLKLENFTMELKRIAANAYLLSEGMREVDDDAADAVGHLSDAISSLFIRLNREQVDADLRARHG